MYWQAPSFSIIRLSILISRATAKLVSDLDPSLRAAIDHLSLVRARWHKRTKIRQWLWAVCQPQQRNDFILYAGIGTYNGGDRNQITSACSHCLLTFSGWELGRPPAITNLIFLVQNVRTSNITLENPINCYACAPTLSVLAFDSDTYIAIYLVKTWVLILRTLESLCWQSELSASVCVCVCVSI